jgi:rhodanese-related sulfurtransferase
MNELLNQNAINSQELMALLDDRKSENIDFVLIDVREQMEYDMGHIKGVDMLRPSTQLQQWGQDIINNFGDKVIILTCRTGARSGHIQRVLKSNGITKVINHFGGIMSFRGEVERG